MGSRRIDARQGTHCRRIEPNLFLTQDPCTRRRKRDGSIVALSGGFVKGLYSRSTWLIPPPSNSGYGLEPYSPTLPVDARRMGAGPNLFSIGIITTMILSF